jgi:hypothetical protein
MIENLLSFSYFKRSKIGWSLRLLSGAQSTVGDRMTGTRLVP